MLLSSFLWTIWWWHIGVGTLSYTFCCLLSLRVPCIQQRATLLPSIISSILRSCSPLLRPSLRKRLTLTMDPLIFSHGTSVIIRNTTTFLLLHGLNYLLWEEKHQNFMITCRSTKAGVGWSSILLSTTTSQCITEWKDILQVLPPGSQSITTTILSKILFPLCIKHSSYICFFMHIYIYIKVPIQPNRIISTAVCVEILVFPSKVKKSLTRNSRCLHPQTPDLSYRHMNSSPKWISTPWNAFIRVGQLCLQANLSNLSFMP